MRRGGWLSLLPAVTLALFLLPVLAGVIGTLLPALGFLPGLGEKEFSLRPLRALLGAPELPGALIATLIGGAKPVPALRDIRRLGLRRIGDQECSLLSQIVHPRAGSKVVGRLGAAVQHHHKGQRLFVIATRNIEL
jgi:hypothetical protein